MTKRIVLVFSSASLATLLLLALFTLMATLNTTPVQAAPVAERQPAPAVAPLQQTTTTPTYAISDSITGGIVYDWVEISGSGTDIGLSGDNEGSDAEIDIGFYFPFYDNVYRTFRASTNGYIYFGGTGGPGGSAVPSYVGPPFGDISAPDNFIAAFGADLYMHPEVSQIYVSQQPTRTIVEFVDVQWCCGLNDPHTFEIILYHDGRILTQYRQIRFLSNRNEYVVAGIENNDGSDGVAYYEDWFAENALLDDGLAVLYDPGDTIFGHLILDPPAQTWWEDPGQTGSFDVTLFNLIGFADTFAITYSLDISSSVVPTESLWPVGVPDMVGQPGSAWLPLPNLGESTFQVTATIPITADWWDMATLHITASATTSPTISNTVAITYGTAQRDLSIEKTMDPDPIAPGGYFRYHVTVSNYGNRPAQARTVQVTDRLPDQPEFIRFDPPGSVGTLLLPGFFWDVGDMDAGSDASLDVYMRVPVTVPEGTVLTNTAWTTMTGSIERGPFDNNIVTHTTTVTTPRLVFDIVKVFADPDDENEIGAGQIATYTIAVANLGNVPITGAIVTDVIPLGTIFHGTTWPTYTLLPDDRTLVFTIGTLLNGGWNGVAFEVGVQVPATTTIGAWLTNTVQVTTTASLVGFAQAQGDSAVEVIQVIDPRGDPWVEKFPEETGGGNPVTPEPGGDYTFWIKYGNDGYVTVYTVTLTDTLPVAYVALLEAGPAGTVQPITTTPGLVVWRIPDLAAGEYGWTRVRIKIDEHTPAGTQLLNTAEITAAEGLNITTTNDVSVVTVTLDAADVTVNKWVTPTGTLEVEDWVTYTVRFSNTGVIPAAGVRITDVLPDGLTNVGWMTGEHPLELLSGAPPLLVWRATEPLTQGHSGLITVTAQLDPAHTWPPQSLLTNRAEIHTVTGEEPSHDPNVAEVSNPVALASPYVVKTGPTLALPGDLISYTIEYGNGGLLAAQDVYLTDTLPVSATYVTDTSGLTTATGANWIAWEAGAIPSATTGLTFTLVVSVSPDVEPGTPLRNTVVLTSASYDGDLTDNESEWLTPVGFDLSNSYKQVNGSDGISASPGTPVTYTIVLTNRGPYSATSVAVWDPVPADTAYITNSLSSSAGNDGYDPVSDAITWTGVVSGNTRITITFQVTVADAGPLPHGTLITNTAFISDSIQTFQASVPVTITGPNLDGSYKTVNNLHPSTGERITYTIVMRNSGEVDATARVTDALPSLYVSYTGGGWASSGSLGGGGSGDPITWTGTVTRGERVTISLPVDVIALPGNIFDNVAQIDDGTGVVIPRSVTVSVTQPILDTSATRKAASTNALASGQRVTYTITIRNDGTGAAPSARMTDTIQGGTYVTSEVTASSGAIEASPPPTITWSGSLAPGDSVAITIPVTITATPGSDVDNVAWIDDGYGTVFARSTSVHVYSSADISGSTKTVDLDQALPGETLIYTLTVDNDGELDTPFFVTDTLDANTVFSAFLASPPGSYGHDAGVITWTGMVSDLNQALLSFQATISDSVSGAVTNTARFDDGAGNVYTRTATTRIVVPELSAAKRVEPQREVFAGGYLTYTVVMSNGSGATAQASFSDTMPAHTSYVTNSAHVTPTTYNAPVYHFVTDTLTWEDTILPGEVVTLTFQVQVERGTVTGTVVNNVAWFQELRLPGPVFSASVTNTVQSPVLSAAKRATPAGDVRTGETITYSIVLTNAEGGVARVVLTDSIPAHTNYVANDFGAIYDHGNDRLTWQGDIGPRSVVTLTFVVTVSHGVTAGVVISNVAQVQELSQPAVILRPTVTNTIIAPELSAAKGVKPQREVFAGAFLTYTIVMSNSGEATAQASFRDPTPAHTTYVTNSAHVTPTTYNAPVYHLVTDTLTWEDTILPGEVVTLTFQAQVEPGTVTGTTISNVAWFQELGEPGPVFSASVTNTVRAPVFSAVKLSTPPGGVRAGEAITYSIVLVNAKGGVARVTMTDTIPAHTTYVTNSFGASYDPGHNWLTWQGDVGPHSVVTLTFVVTVHLELEDGTVISNVAWLQESSQPVVVTVSVTNTVAAPVLRAAKRVETPPSSVEAPAGTVYPGDVLTYTIVMTNSGGASAQVSFSDEMPAHTTYVTGSAQISPPVHQTPVYHPATSALTWEDDVAPGSVAILTFEVRVNPGAPDGTLISNVAWLQEVSEPGPIFSVTVTSTVQAPVFSAAKWATPAGSVHPGEVINYRIVLTNATVGVARAIVTDTIPTHTTYISGSAGIDAGGLILYAGYSPLVVLAVNDQILDPPTYDPVHNRLTWRGDIASHSAVTLTFGVTVNLGVDAGTIITNVAWVDELSDPAEATGYSVTNVVTGYSIYLPVVLRNY